MLDSMPEGSEKCPLCGGNTWIFVDPNDNSKGVRRCECYQRGLIEGRIQRSGLSLALESCTFDSFKDTEPWQKTLKRKAELYRNILTSAPLKKPWLFIGGNSGCGKTHLCTAICGELLKKGQNVRYMLWMAEVHDIKAAVNDEGYTALLQPYLTADVLYIDDLLKSKGNRNLNPSDADIKICFELLNGRYIRNLPTIISSEFYLDSELIAVDEATFSRVIEKTGSEFLISVDRNPDRNFRLKGVRKI